MRRLHRLNRVRSAWHPIFLRRRHCQIASASQSPPSGPLPIMIWNGGKDSYFYSQGVQLHRLCVTHGQTALRASPEMVALNELRLRCLTAISSCDGYLLGLR